MFIRSVLHLDLHLVRGGGETAKDLLPGEPGEDRYAGMGLLPAGIASEDSVILLKYKEENYSYVVSADAGAGVRSPSLSSGPEIRDIDAFRLPNRS